MKLYNLICPICGEKFIGNKNSKYCSPGCADAAYRERKEGKVSAKSVRKRNLIEAEERLKRLAARDAAYAAEYQDMASGSVRGRIAVGGRCGVIRDDASTLVGRFISPTYTK